MQCDHRTSPKYQDDIKHFKILLFLKILFFVMFLMKSYIIKMNY
jgi:hypothetical protein